MKKSTMPTQGKTSMQSIFKEIREAIRSSLKSMVRQWQIALEEASLNPQTNYQKPLHHQPKANRKILYQLSKNEPKAFFKPNPPKEKTYEITNPVAKAASFNRQPPPNTLYEVTSSDLKTNLIYESSQNKQNFKYPNALSIGYQKSNLEKVNFIKKEKDQRQYSLSQKV